MPLNIACSNIFFQVADGTNKALSKLFPHKIAEIQIDLSTLKLNGILHSAKLWTFCSFGDSFPNLFYTSILAISPFLHVTFAMIAGCCMYVEEVENKLNKCGHEHHDYLLPHFYANKGLKSRYEEIIKAIDKSRRCS